MNFFTRQTVFPKVNFDTKLLNPICIQYSKYSIKQTKMTDNKILKNINKIVQNKLGNNMRLISDQICTPLSEIVII